MDAHALTLKNLAKSELLNWFQDLSQHFPSHVGGSHMLQLAMADWKPLRLNCSGVVNPIQDLLNHSLPSSNWETHCDCLVMKHLVAHVSNDYANMSRGDMHWYATNLLWDSTQGCIKHSSNLWNLWSRMWQDVMPSSMCHSPTDSISQIKVPA